MALHLLKLCVGCESVEDLEGWIFERLAEKKCNGLPLEQYHTTRMVPKRVDELLAGGSLYWIIKGGVQCRQSILDVRPFTDSEGIGRCHLVLANEVIRTQWQPRRPFQGWRYLQAADAPGDLAAAGAVEEMPPALQKELAELGLL